MKRKPIVKIPKARKNDRLKRKARRARYTKKGCD